MRQPLTTVRALRRVLVLLTVSFAVVVALIRAQPYTTPDDLDVLLPPDCDLPCPLGIIPGETTVAEANALIDAHPLVASRMGNRWTWQPGVALVAVGGFAPGEGAYDADAGGVVTEVRVDMRVPLGALRTRYGSPDAQYAYFQHEAGLSFLEISDVYGAAGFSLRYRALCGPSRYRIDLFRREASLAFTRSAPGYADNFPSTVRRVVPETNYQEIACPNF
ncbi:MAG: hypothetical protein AAF125_21515 [Chloroflexota bacterium]